MHVSVIIPCYCCSDTIMQAMESIGNQTVLPKEVIVVDDASPDDGATIGRLNALPGLFVDIPFIRIISLTKNIGPSGARNIGWENATQKYIAFLDADDAWHPKKIEIQYAFMKDHRNVILSAHEYTVIKSKYSDPVEIANRFDNVKIKSFNALLSNPMATSTTMILKKLPFRFNPAKRYSEDFLLWLQILLSGYEVRKIKLPLTFYFKDIYGQSGLSCNLWKMEKGEIDTYRHLKNEKLIGYWAYICLICLSLNKFFIRTLVVMLRRIYSKIIPSHLF